METLLRRCNLPRRILDDPNALIPMASTAKLIEKMAELDHSHTLGAKLGQVSQLSEIGGFGKLIETCSSVLDAINTAVSYLHIHGSAAKIWLEQRRGQSWVCHQYLAEFGEGGHQASLFVIMLSLNLIRQATGPNWKPLTIYLQMPPVREILRMEELTGVHLVFRQPYSALIFPAKVLSLPLPQTSEEKRREALEEAERLARDCPALDLAGSLRQLIESQLHGLSPGIQRLADSVGMSVRTLQRRLDEEGICYSSLLEQVRFQRACRMLSDPTVKVPDVAVELGYRDRSNFNRAFRRWAGMSPSEYRELMEET